MTARSLPTPDISEKAWQAQVVELAEMCHWTVNHTRASIGGRKQGWVTATTCKGWLDLCCIRPPRVLFAELKVGRGRLTPEQQGVLALLQQCPGVETFVWWPRDLDTIAEVLR